ncbi:MAG: sensor domain-containing diguanylate cyclase [Synergistales bacterium]|nr:sensor domain-containing diguanylate cyclase [Synergistales bacterium]
MKKALEQIRFDIAMAIGSSLDMEQMLKNALSCYMEKLDCSCCVVWDCVSSSRPTMVFSIPEDVTSLGYRNFIEERIPGYFEDLSRRETSCPNELNPGENKGTPWCLFKLADFGFFLLVRKSGIFEGALLKILEPLNEKLARSCRACRSHELLKRTIQQRALMEKAFRKSEERFHLALEATNDGIWDWEIRTGRVYFSPSYYSMLGYEPYELPQSYHTWEGLLHPDERESVKERIFKHIENKDQGYEIEFRLKTREGGWLWVLSRGKVVERDKDGSPLRLVGTHSDISRRKEFEEQMEKMNRELYISATTDRLTGLLNRQRFEEILILEMDRAARYGNSLSMLMFDIDDFKKLNDSLGHQAGDVALQEVAQVIQKRIRSSDYSARWGGDEFMILLLADMDNAFSIADSLRKEIAICDIPGIGGVTISIGVVQYGEKDDVDSLIKRADDALYRAKTSGRNRTEKG